MASASTQDPPPVATPRFSDSPNARSKTVTTTDGPDTHGTLNQHRDGNNAYQVGVHDDRGQRRTMEDAYSFVVDFAGVRGQGYFAVFDGHAGKHAAEWCGAHFHEHLLACLQKHARSGIPDVLNYTFHSVDTALSAIAENDDKMHSGCTAVTAFLRIEDAQGTQSFLPTTSPAPISTSPTDATSPATVDSPSREDSRSASPSSSSSGAESNGATRESKQEKKKTKKRTSRLVSAFKALSSSSQNVGPPSDASASSKPGLPASSPPDSAIFAPPAHPPLRRVLYTANAGDARGVLCRAGKAVRLTYDHKGSDKQEAKRITDAGGFVMGGRVNGVLAVTRSLGDSSMKEFVVGSPYTTETELGEDDEFLILACDGLWDIASDQEAIDLVRGISDAQAASRALVEFALKDSTDNVTVVVVRFASGRS